MKPTWGFAVVLGGALLVPGLASADAVAPSDVTIKDGEISASLTGTKGDPKAGKDWFVGRKLGNCLACHANSDSKNELFHGEVGPSLDGVADRYNEAQLRAIVVNSKSVFGDGTIMPSFYRTSGLNHVGEEFTGKSILTAQQVEDVVAYLTTLKE